VTTIGILHPGEMGSSVAAAARAGGSRVVWASAGRGEATRKRAARKAGGTRLYLSGPGAADVAAHFKGSLLEAIVLDGPVGAASAIKMAYAGWNKGSQALLLAIRALAAHEGVDAALVAEWARSQPDVTARSERAVSANIKKAWRFVGEMEEIAATFEAAGLPDGFHEAAGEIYRRLAGWKDTATPPSMAEVAKTLAP